MWRAERELEVEVEVNENVEVKVNVNGKMLAPGEAVDKSSPREIINASTRLTEGATSTTSVANIVLLPLDTLLCCSTKPITTEDILYRRKGVRPSHVARMHIKQIIIQGFKRYAQSDGIQERATDFPQLQGPNRR